MNKIKFNIDTINTCTFSEGPHKRLAIWFQGCNLDCYNCCNKDLQPFIPKQVITLEKLINIIKKTKETYNIEGITLLGGEPTLQNGLDVLCTEVRKLHLGTILYTGKLIDTLTKDLIEAVDIIIDGPYVEANKDHHRTNIGSCNQTIHYITNRYLNDHTWFARNQQIKEYHIHNDTITFNGEPL